MFRDQNNNDHMWANRELLDSRYKRRQISIQYQNDLKAQIAEKEARKRDKLVQKQNEDGFFKYNKQDNINNFARNNNYGYNGQPVVQSQGYPNQTFLSHVGEPSFPSSVAQRKSQFAEVLRGKIEEAKRSGSSLNAVVPPLSSVYTAIPFSFGATTFDESTFSFAPSQVRAYRAIPPSERSHINQLNMFTANEIKRSFNTHLDFNPDFVRYSNPIKLMKVATPQYGFSVRKAPTFQQEPTLQTESEFTFPDGSTIYQ